MKQIEELSFLYSEIKRLDSEISNLQNLAMKVAEGNCRIKMNLSIEDLSAPPAYKEPEQEIGFFASYVRGFQTTTHLKPENVEELDDFLTLHMLGFLLKDKVEQRESYIKQIRCKSQTS